MRTIINLFGAALIVLGLLGFFFFLVMFSGPGAAYTSGGAVPMMWLQTQGLIVSATMLVSGVVIWCSGTRKL